MAVPSLPACSVSKSCGLCLRACPERPSPPVRRSAAVPWLRPLPPWRPPAALEPLVPRQARCELSQWGNLRSAPFRGSHSIREKPAALPRSPVLKVGPPHGALPRTVQAWPSPSCAQLRRLILCSSGPSSRHLHGSPAVGSFTRPHILRVVPPCPELSVTCPSHRSLLGPPAVCLSYYCFICCFCLEYSQLLKSRDLAHLLMLLYL